MNFKLTEEQELIRKNIREFCVKNVEPIAAEIDEKEAHPADLFKKLAEGGWMGIPIPSQYGGSGADYLTHAIVVEELSRSCSSTGFTVSIHVGIACMLINLLGSEEQKKKYLVPLATGQHLGAFVLTEPGAGTDVMAATTTAAKDGDAYVLNGTKTFISNGPLADTYLVFCWTDKAAGRKGMSSFIIPKGTPGLKPGEHFHKMGLRSSQTSEVVFKDCRVPAANLLGAEGAGMANAGVAFDHGRVGIAAQGVGIAEATYRIARDYAASRRQFSVAIEKLPAVRDMLIDMKTSIEAGRALLYETSRIVDLALAYNNQAENHPPADKEAAKRLKDNARIYKRYAGMLTPMSKYYCTEMCNRVAYDSIQVLGGSGFMRDYACERHARDARITTIYEGTSQLQIVAAVRGVCSGTAEKYLTELAALPYDPRVSSLLAKLAEGGQQLQEAIEFTKAQGNDYMDLHGRELVDVAIDLINGYLFCGQASTKVEMDVPVATNGAHSSPNACGSEYSVSGSSDSRSPTRVPPPGADSAVRPSWAPRPLMVQPR